MHDIDVSEEAGVRFLHFGSEWVQGAMRISRPYGLELEYTREMMLPLLLHPEPWPKRILLIGLGAGSLTKFLWKQRPESKLTVIEIDPRMEAVAQIHFKFPDDPERIRIRLGDGAAFVATSRLKFDLILVDGFDADARAGALDSTPFYLNCRARLADEGLLCVNLLSRRRDFSKSVNRLMDAFDGHALAFPSCNSGNAITIAADASLDKPLSSDELKDAARRMRKTSGLDLMPTLARLAPALSSGLLQL
jgi:spermidine synthase